MLRQLSVWLMLLAFGLVACTPAEPAAETPEATPDPQALLESVIDRLRELETFRLLIEQTGAPYPFFISLDEGQTVQTAYMRRGEAQFIVPETLGGTMTLRVGGIPTLNVDIFAIGEDQWFKLFGQVWINYPIAVGFDPGELLREDTGFSAALTKMNELEYIAAETMVDGTPVHHVRGVASGQVMNELLFGLLEVEQELVYIDVFINRNDNTPTLIEVRIPDTATETEADTVWRIEVYDVDAAPDIATPRGVEL